MATYSGGLAAYRMAAFAPPSDREINYMRERLESRMSLYRDTARNYKERALDIFDRVTSSAAVARAREMWRNTRNAYAGDYLTCLQTIEQMQTARPVMQRWVMACPEVLRANRKQRIDGYSDTWKDLEADEAPEDRLDYKLVTHGLLQVHKEDSNYLCMDWHYGLPDDEVLTPTERHDILDTWAAARAYLAAADADPTSPYGSRM